MKAPPLILFFFIFLDNNKVGKYHHKSIIEYRKGVIVSKNFRNLGTGGIKFEPTNIPVHIMWKIEDLIKILGTMLGDSNSIKD